MTNKPENFSTDPCRQMSDVELKETWDWYNENHSEEYGGTIRLNQLAIEAFDRGWDVETNDEEEIIDVIPNGE